MLAQLQKDSKRKIRTEIYVNMDPNSMVLNHITGSDQKVKPNQSVF